MFVKKETVTITMLRFIFALCMYVDSARILAIVPTPSYSHESAFRPIWEALASKGHEIVLMTTAPKNDKNFPSIKEIDWSFTHDLAQNKYAISRLKHESGKNVFKLAVSIFEARNIITDLELSHSDVQTLLKNESEHFDLVMAEFVLPTMYAFAYRFDAPLIGMLSSAAFNFAHCYIGDFVHITLLPDFTTNGDYKTFGGRLKSFISEILLFVLNKYFSKPSLQQLAYRHFGGNCPDIDDLSKNIDLLISFSNPVLSTIRPVVPAHIHVNALHIKPPKPLQKEIQDYMDDSKNGVIFFSLGSSVKSKDIPEDIQILLMETFSELPYEILWKFESTEMRKKPENVKIINWAQQQDILRHPKLKLFITQGGLQSIEEALYTHNAMLVLPVAGDQEYNAKMVVSRGYGKQLNMETMNKETLKSTIFELINNPKYKETVVKMAKLSLDQPMTSLDRAVWWTEYVIRHKGAKHLKGSTLNAPMYQYLMLDVLSFCLAVVLILLYCLYRLLYFVIYIFRKLVSYNHNKKNN